MSVFDYSESTNKIPKIIIQTWKTRQIGGVIGNLIQKLKSNNPDFEYKFFDDNDIIQFIETEYPEYLDTFNNFEYTIQKIDFFRYLAIHHFGGFYFDIDMDINKNISELCKYECIFPKESNLDTDILDFRKHNLKIVIGNYAFGACPKNSFLKLCIDNIVNTRIKHSDIPNNNKRYETCVQNHIGKMIALTSYMDHVLYTTGPVLISQSYIDFIEKEKIKILICDNSSVKYPFGNFGYHLAIGTWKNT